MAASYTYALCFLALTEKHLVHTSQRNVFPVTLTLAPSRLQCDSDDSKRTCLRVAAISHRILLDGTKSEAP